MSRTVMIAVRGAPVPFTETRKLTRSYPNCGIAERIVTHGAAVCAVQKHPSCNAPPHPLSVELEMTSNAKSPPATGTSTALVVTA